MNEYEARKKAREETGRRLYEHEKAQGKNPSFDSVQRHVNERADICDKKKDWNIKD